MSDQETASSLFEEVGRLREEVERLIRERDGAMEEANAADARVVAIAGDLCDAQKSETDMMWQRRRVEERLESFAWRPLSSAPRDGTKFLMWMPGDDDLGYHETISSGFISSSSGELCLIGSSSPWEDGIEPTHWMPFPEAPEDAA